MKQEEIIKELKYMVDKTIQLKPSFYFMIKRLIAKIEQGEN